MNTCPKVRQANQRCWGMFEYFLQLQKRFHTAPGVILLEIQVQTASNAAAAAVE